MCVQIMFVQTFDLTRRLGIYCAIKNETPLLTKLVILMELACAVTELQGFLHPFCISKKVPM